MTEVKPYHNILLIGLFALIVTAIVALIAYLTIGRNDEERNNDIMNLATLKTRNVAPIGWQLSKRQ